MSARCSTHRHVSAPERQMWPDKRGPVLHTKQLVVVVVPSGRVQRPNPPWLLPLWHFPGPREDAQQPCTRACAPRHQTHSWSTPPCSSFFPACLPGPSSFLWSRIRPQPWIYLLSRVKFNPTAISPICSKNPPSVQQGRELGQIKGLEKDQKQQFVHREHCNV